MSISGSKKTQHIVAQRIASVPAPTSEVDIAQLHQSLPFILTSALEMLIDEVFFSDLLSQRPNCSQRNKL